MGQSQAQISGIEKQVQIRSQEIKKESITTTKHNRFFKNVIHTTYKRYCSNVNNSKSHFIQRETNYVRFLMGKNTTRIKSRKTRMKEMKHSPKLKDIFEYNVLKSEFTDQPNKTPEIAGSNITKDIQSNIANKEFKEAKK